MQMKDSRFVSHLVHTRLRRKSREILVYHRRAMHKEMNQDFLHALRQSYEHMPPRGCSFMVAAGEIESLYEGIASKRTGRGLSLQSIYAHVEYEFGVQCTESSSNVPCFRLMHKLDKEAAAT